MTNLLLPLTILWQTAVDPNSFNNFLMLGYAAMWFIGMLYITSLIIRQRNVQQDIQLMQQILQEDENDIDT